MLFLICVPRRRLVRLRDRGFGSEFSLYSMLEVGGFEMREVGVRGEEKGREDEG